MILDVLSGFKRTKCLIDRLESKLHNRLGKQSYNNKTINNNDG